MPAVRLGKEVNNKMIETFIAISMFMFDNQEID